MEIGEILRDNQKSTYDKLNQPTMKKRRRRRETYLSDRDYERMMINNYGVDERQCRD